MRHPVKIAALVLVAATVLVYATEWMPFMWPVMAVLDAAVAYAWHRRRNGVAA
jgi:hypothetical protein